MKATIFPLLVFLASALAVLGQEHAEFTAWMKATDTAWKALEKIEAKTGPEAVRAAETLGAVCEDMIGFWRGRNAAAAVKWSEEGKSAAVRLATAAHAGSAEKAAAAFKTLEATCNSCHDAYRVSLPDGKYRINWSAGPARGRQRKTQ